VLVTSHVLTGALIGRAMARHPVGAFAVGVVSHFAMDACPHYGDDGQGYDSPDFFRVACCDGCAGLAAMALAAGLSPRRSRRAVVAGMLGGAVVDSDKPAQFFFGWDPWPKWWGRFHKRVQTEDPGRMPQEVMVAAALAALVVVLLPARRNRAAS